MGVYKKSLEYNYYSRLDGQSISYSDGSDIENKVFDIVKSVKDKSVLSDELTSHIHDWPTEYHFSKSRHCILRPLPFKRDDSILELGCGCGAITRYLGEIGADVDSVEGTYSRARVAGERCADLSNVTIYVDNLLKFESDKQYDWVLFIGVLEYAPLFSEAEDAVQHYLNEAKKHLKPSGKLVVAIENKLGLKYLNGCGEDHVSEPYFGVENRYPNKGPVTFGKEELSLVLNNVGFHRLEYFYPFPDYKLPNVVIHESAFTHKMFAVSEVLRGLHSRDYNGRLYRAFDESFVWPELEKNHLIEALSNSFLVVADADNRDEQFSNTLAWYYNTHRRKSFATETIFNSFNDEIFVEKKCLVTGPIVDGEYFLKELKEKYILGETLQTIVENVWHKTGSKEKMLDIYRIWLDFVINKSNYAEKKSIAKATIDACHVDLTPFNIKINSTSGVSYFDQEWISNAEIPLIWLIFRGLYWSLNKLNTVHALEMNVQSEIWTLLKNFKINIDEDAFKYAIDREISFIYFVNGSEPVINLNVHKYPSRFTYLEVENLTLQEENKALIFEIEVMRELIDKFDKLLPVRVLRKAKRILKIK
jgi:SAM-dependent methyltransferase